MQSELNCFPLHFGGLHQNEQQIWNSCLNNLDFPPHDMEDLFGESNEYFSVEQTNDVIPNDGFSVFANNENNMTADYSIQGQYNKTAGMPQHHYSFNPPSNVCLAPQAIASIYPSPFNSHFSSDSFQSSSKRVEKSLSFDRSGCSQEEFFSTSDTDSGIHSPGAIRPPPDDALCWKKSLENGKFEAFLQRPSHPHVPKTENAGMGNSSPPFCGQETQLLNMDDQQRYNAIPLRNIHPPNSPLLLGNQDYRGCAESIKLERLEHPPLSETWPSMFCPDDKATSGSLPVSYSSQATLGRTVTQRRQKKTSKPRHSPKKTKKGEKGKSSPHLWEFIRDIVLNPKYNPSLMKWEDRETGVFRFVQSDTVASMWGQEKQNTKMTYEKLSRAMRYYYNRGILERVDGRRLVYKFGPSSHGWKNSPKLASKPKSSASNTRPVVSISSNSTTCASTSELAESLDANLSLHTNSSEALEISAGFPPVSLPSANVLLAKNHKIATA